jgi:hypothetical protein
MPMTRPKTTDGPTTQPYMKHATSRDDDESEDSHIDRIRSNYNTTDLDAIMGRFFNAVSWRSH